VEARAERTQNVAAVKLGNGEEIEGGGEKSDPGGAAHRMKQECAGGNAGMQPGGEESQEKWSAEGEIDFLQVVEARNNFGVEGAVSEGRNGQNETHKWAGSADVKESTGGANGGTDQNESAESADERREGNKKWIAGADVMMATGEEMAELVSEQNGEQRECEGQAGSESRWAFVKKSEGFEKLVERNGLILRVSGSKLSAGNQAGAKSEKK